jgi:pimeloyl-[acyl-carrier protein] methyl ester esterase
MAKERMEWVLLPGLDGTGILFDDFAELSGMREEVSVVRYDPGLVAGYDEHVEQASGQLPEGRQILIAESFSGPIALRLAQRYPDRVRAVVLCASFVLSPVGPWGRVFPWDILFRIPPPEWAIRRWLIGDHPTVLPDFYKALALVSPRVLAARCEAMAQLEVDNFHPVGIPVLALWALRDALVSRRNGEAIQQVCRRVRNTEIDGPHLVIQCRPREVLAAVRTFAEEL